MGHIYTLRRSGWISGVAAAALHVAMTPALAAQSDTAQRAAPVSVSTRDASTLTEHSATNLEVSIDGSNLTNARYGSWNADPATTSIRPRHT